VVLTRYKTNTIVHTHTITKTITKTKVVTKDVAPKVPAGAFMPSKRPQIAQHRFMITRGDIACLLAAAGVRCEIQDRDWTAPIAPATCTAQWGSTIALGNIGGAKFACGGANPLTAGGKVIPAGWDDTVGNYTCQIRSFGVDCFNAKSRRGFMISRTGYSIY
jgi:hypothetical protein